LYRVNCIHKSFDVNNSKVIDDEGEDEFENIQVLSLQFNEQGNILAAGDSNGRVQVKECELFFGLKDFFLIS
jgi:hypothetical protein